jgi:hypothetical protein
MKIDKYSRRHGSELYVIRTAHNNEIRKDYVEVAIKNMHPF